MAVPPLSAIVSSLRRTTILTDDELTDAHLLGQFIDKNDAMAFEELVRRHGPMVLGVCRRLLRSAHDVEDAFQATFFVLVRKAASLQSRDRLANWLYGVAYNTALAARAQNLRRCAREKQVSDMPEPTGMPPDARNDLRLTIDEALCQIPDIYREAIVLCDLEGATRKEAAAMLGIPEGTMSSRLTTGRRRLAALLARSGVTTSGSLVATLLSQSAAPARVPEPLATSTVNIATLMGAPAMNGSIPPQVVALTEQVLKAMPLNKAKTLALVALSFLLLTATSFVGFVLAAPSSSQKKKGQKQGRPTRANPRKEDDKKFIDECQRELIKYLAKLDPDARYPDVRKDMYRIIESFGDKLRPARGARKWVSSDRSFVLVIAANDVTPRGQPAKASDPRARIVMAVGGNGAARTTLDAPPCSGGSAMAVAPRGVAIALAGRGGTGHGRAGAGGAGGAGGTTCVGAIGTLCLGGTGGRTSDGVVRGGPGRGEGILGGRAIRAAFAQQIRPPKPLDPKRVAQLEELARQLDTADKIAPLAARIRHALGKPGPKPIQPIEGEAVVDQLQMEMTRYLGILDPDARVADVREDLYRIVDPLVGKLRPTNGSKTYISRDKAFVLVIGANGARSAGGASVSGYDPKARIVFAVGGDCTKINPGGAATAVAPRGVGIALGGRSGAGAGGSGTNGQGGIGALCLGGRGGSGEGFAGPGSDGPCKGIVNGKAILKAFQNPLDPKIVMKVKEWIRRLGSEDFKKREQATEALLKMGRDIRIIPRLRAALSTDDPEVRKRIMAILEKLK